MGICCTSNEKNRIKNEIEDDIHGQFIVVYSKVGCPRCLRVKTQLHSIRANPKVIEVSSLSVKAVLKELTMQKSLPYVFIGGKFIENRKLEVEISKGLIQEMITEHRTSIYQ